MLLVKIATRFITSRKSQSIFIILAFSIGIATNIFIGNLIMAIEQDLVNRTVNSQPHISIEAENGQFLENYKDIIPQLDEIDEISVYSKKLSGHAFLVEKDEKTHDTIVMGLSNFDDGAQIHKFLNDDFRGKTPQESHHVLIGDQMANNLDIKIGDPLNVTISPVAPLNRILEVTGIFTTGQSSLDANFIIGEIIMAGFVFYAIDSVSSIIIQVDDYMKADTVANEIANLLDGKGVVVYDWKTQNSALLNSLQAQSISTKLVQGFILLSITIAMGSLLNITVVQKQKQLGILKAMGLTNRESARLFLHQGGILGTIGTIIGGILAFIFISIFNFVGNEDIVTIQIDPVFTLISVTISITAAILVSLLPARASRKMSIIEIIRRS